MTQQPPIAFNPFADPTALDKEWINPYVEKMREAYTEGTLPILYGPNLLQMPGKWRASLRSDEGVSERKLYVEIGCHLGKVLSEMAAAAPDADFVGLDITFKRVVSSATKAQRRGLRNVLCARCDAKFLNQVFAEGEIDGVVIFFPDPWTKPSHVKHRLVSASFVQVLARVLKPGGWVWIKTDQADYFQTCQALLTAGGFAIASAEVLQNPLLAATWQSSFERLFHSRNVPTNGQVWVNSTIKN